MFTYWTLWRATNHSWDLVSCCERQGFKASTKATSGTDYPRLPIHSDKINEHVRLELQSATTASSAAFKMTHMAMALHIPWPHLRCFYQYMISVNMYTPILKAEIEYAPQH